MPVLVKDIYPGMFSGIMATPNAAVVGNTLYFEAGGTNLNEEMWKTDGTEAGTVMVKDINPGNQGSQQQFYTVYNNQLYFTAFVPGMGTELWRTDEQEGAVPVAGDLCPGDCSGAFYGTTERLFITFNDQLYLRLRNELWRSDGTEQGTVLFKDINPGASTGDPFGFVVFKDKMYFAADSASAGTELWVSDGTGAGTHMVKNINTDFFGGCNMGTPVVGEDAFYFWATNSNGNGNELYKSDGTAAGTVLLKEIRPGSAGGQASYSGNIPMTNSAWVGNKLLFPADNGSAGAELWITDGTTAGTFMLKDILVGSNGSNPHFIATIGNLAFFRAQSTNGYELWASDGTSDGTYEVKDIRSGTGDGLSPNFPVPFAVYENKLYFRAVDGMSGTEIWVTDGTSAGTYRLFDLYPGAANADPEQLKIMGDYLYFFAKTATTGTELWKYSLKTSSVENPALALEARLYPSLSSSGQFFLDYAESDPLDIAVFDALGRQVSQVQLPGGTPLLLTTLPAGTYWVKISNHQGHTATQQVSIMR